MDKVKVLMADDDIDILDVMAKKISSAGFDVVKAVDGNDAIAKIQEEDPDVILLDINMPYKDGFEVLKDLRDREDTGKWKPVIIISANGELENIKKGYDLEADHYISKPCTMGDILKSINLMLTLIEQRRGSE